MDGWILVGIGVVSLLCFLVGIWANWILGRADSADTGRPVDYYLRASLGSQTGSLTDKQLLTIEAQRASTLALAMQQPASPQWAASQSALAAQLAHTTVTSQWNGGNYGQTYTTSDDVADKIQEAMRVWGCTHWLSCIRSINKFATEVRHDDLQYDIYAVDQYGVDTATKLAECLAWLQSVCDGSGEFWGWHEAWGVWDEAEQLHVDYLE